MSWILWFIKSCFCSHAYEYHHTAYGDEINHANGKRTYQVCSKCGQGRYV